MGRALRQGKTAFAGGTGVSGPKLLDTLASSMQIDTTLLMGCDPDK